MLPPKFEQEVEVQVYYSQILSQLVKCSFSARFRTDGIFYNKETNIKILAEFKVHGDLNNNDLFIRGIIQILCYIKKIEDSGEMLPNIIFIGNENHFAIFDSNILNNYTKYVDSSMTPSTMFSTPPKYLKDLLLKEINIKKYRRSDLSFLKNLIENFKDKSIGLKMTINNNNITRIFEDFITSNVLNQKLSENQKVALFASIIFDECNDIVNKPNQIVTPYSEFPLVKINRENYDIFLSMIKSINRPSSKSEIIAQSDRLIEEVSRRFHGEFYTPKIWVDEAHKMIEKQFGIDWKEKYIVWDPACGTGNLTRDYLFKKLYCSTLHPSDIDIMNQRNYNNEAVKFQYDFLNDDVYPEGLGGMVDEDKLKGLAPGLIKAFEENKPIIIIMNPPFGSSGELRQKEYIGKKTNVAKTKTNKIMLQKGMQRSSLQLYSQFIFKIILLKERYKLNNVVIASFSPVSLLVTPSFSYFRKRLFKSFCYNNSFTINSGEFSDVSGTFAISFFLFSTGLDIRTSFNTEVLFLKNKNITRNNKILYNSDNTISLATWVREEIKGKKLFDQPKLTNALTIKEDDRKGKGIDNQIGFIHFCGNVVYQSITGVSIFSSTNSVEYNGFPIIKDNFYKIISSFSARKLTVGDWLSSNDEYLKPNISHKDYQCWNIDCIVHSFFNSSSQQSSLRNIIYKNKTWNIENQFFWLPNSMMKQLADDNGFDELYQDSISFNQERFVYKELQKVKLSPDAIDVLNKANELVVKSFPERKRLHNLHPEWHLNAWDAGWYQIKKVLNDCMKDDLKEFNILYKEFENRMREGVYKFGFLK